MKTTKYTGTFIATDGHEYQFDVYSFGFTQAFFFLTADAIRSGRHYQLNKITDEKGESLLVGNIRNMGIFI